MTREEVRARIEEIGVIPAIRVSTAEDALLAAAAVGVAGHLIPKKAIQLRQPHRIHELARRFVGAVDAARRELKTVSGDLPGR